MDDDILIIPVLIYPADGQFWAQSMLFRDYKTSGPTASAAVEGLSWAIFSDLDLIIGESDMGRTRSTLTSRCPSAALWARFAEAQVNYFEDLLSQGRRYCDEYPRRDSIAFLKIPLAFLYDSVDDQPTENDCLEDDFDGDLLDGKGASSTTSRAQAATHNEAPPLEARRSLRLLGYPKDTKGDKKPN